MKTTWTGLLITDTAWAIGLRDGDRSVAVPVGGASGVSADGVEATDHAERIAATLELAKEHRAHPGPLVVGLPSSWCFASPVRADGLARRQRRSGLNYRLEERLPIDAEAFTADFIAGPERCLGVAVRNRPAAALLTQLESAGLTVAHLVPTVFLTVGAGLAENRDASPPPPSQLFRVDTGAGAIDLVRVSDGAVVDWRHLRPDAGSVEAETRALLASSSDRPPVRWIGPPPSREPAETSNGSPPETDATDPLTRAAVGASHLLASGRSPAVDLRRDALAGGGTWPRVARPAWAAMAAAAVLLLSFGLLNVWRAHTAADAAARADAAQAALFRETFPGQRVPAAVLARFRSEAVKAKGMAGEQGTLPPPATTLADLRDVLRGLPDPDTRYQIHELRLEPGRFYLDGRVRSHADADRLAAGLQKRVGYTLEAPRTQNLKPDHATNRAAAPPQPAAVGVTLTGHREEAKP